MIKRIRPIQLRGRASARLIFLLLVLPAAGAGAALFASEQLDSYSVTIEGVENSGLREEMEEVSSAVALRDKPPPTLGLLRVRASSDLDKMKEVLRANGYFSGKITSKIEEEPDRVTVVFRVIPGEPFRLERVDIRTDEKETPPEVELPRPNVLGLEIGRRATFKNIVEGEAKLLSFVKNQGYPFAGVARREVVADYKTRSVAVTFVVSPGSHKRFGPTFLEGSGRVKPAYLRNLIPWQEGDIFRPELLQAYREELVGTGLFSVVEVTEGSRVSPEGKLPVLVKLQEGKRYSLGLGAGYNTDEGGGGKISWEDRNLGGGGERLKILLKAAQQTYSGDVSFRKPDFFHPRQSLILSARAGDDHPPAYTSRSFRLTLLTERKLTGSITFGGGTGFKQSREKQLDEEKDFTLVSLPLYFKWEPPGILGGRLYFSEEPFYVPKSRIVFFKGLLIGKYSLKIFESPYLTISARVTLGSISGCDPEDIPPSERFYAGGSNTVRGYSYQTVGPLADQDPLGGRSLFAATGELNLKIIGPLGVAAFIDGGSAFSSALPRFNDDILWGAGGGARYFSPIGPIGLDAATALDRRKGIDDDFYIYVSIGDNF